MSIIVIVIITIISSIVILLLLLLLIITTIAPCGSLALSARRGGATAVYKVLLLYEFHYTKPIV